MQNLDHEYYEKVKLPINSGALGELTLKTQQELHERLLKDYEKQDQLLQLQNLQIFSSDYWRYPNAVLHLTVSQVNRLVKVLLQAFRRQLNPIKDIEKLDDKNTYFFQKNITQLCSLLLALLRTRGSDDPEIKKILDANSANCQVLREMFEKIILIQYKKKFRMDCSVQLQVKKPDSRKAMPDLLYAVYMYLTGEDGTDDIVITGIDEGDEDIDDDDDDDDDND